MVIQDPGYHAQALYGAPDGQGRMGKLKHGWLYELTEGAAVPSKMGVPETAISSGVAEVSRSGIRFQNGGGAWHIVAAGAG